MWIDATGTSPRQHLLRQLHRLEVGPAHRFIGRAAGTVGFEHLVYHFLQPRLALGNLATTTARTADALGTATGTLWGVVIVVAHGLTRATYATPPKPIFSASNVA